MSLERAYKNCMRCHGLSEAYKSVIKKDEKITNYGNDQIYVAMNEAMRALEEEASAKRLEDENKNTPNYALESCVNCDFSKPNIVETILKVIEHNKKVREHND